jgi:hypothetical protein
MISAHCQQSNSATFPWSAFRNHVMSPAENICCMFCWPPRKLLSSKFSAIVGLSCIFVPFLSWIARGPEVLGFRPLEFVVITRRNQLPYVIATVVPNRAEGIKYLKMSYLSLWRRPIAGGGRYLVQFMDSEFHNRCKDPRANGAVCALLNSLPRQRHRHGPIPCQQCSQNEK